MRCIYCPHGNSDKGRSDTAHPEQDLSLIYGDHMRDLLQETGADKQTKAMIRTGNYRYPFYQTHQPFYDALAEELLYPKLSKQKKTLFYAPSWHNREHPSSFFDAAARLIDHLPAHFNLIIKIHPLLTAHHLAPTLSIIERYRDTPSVLFLQDFPPIYPLLAKSDLYLGDASSIGYDFLCFDKPLYLFKATGPLGKCSREITEHDNPFPFIEQHLSEDATAFSQQRQEVLEYSFGAVRHGKEIAEEITSFLETK
jgi:CDP-glycerol glycerophosphotransferase (TagB/SpsB family)